jgi:hypothetical protein
MRTRIPARYDFNRSAGLAFVMIVAVLALCGVAFLAAIR